jgi:hypothetical protein
MSPCTGVTGKYMKKPSFIARIKQNSKCSFKNWRFKISHNCKVG